MAATQSRIRATKDKESEKFASELIARIEKGRIEGRFDELVVVAPPQFLGCLRAGYGRPLAHAVAAEIGKNLCALPLHELRKRLPQEVANARQT